MPKQVITDAQVTINGVTLTQRVKRVSVFIKERPPALVTAMGDSYEDRLKVDIKDWRVQFEFYQDYSSGQTWQTIKAVFDSTVSSGVPIIVRPTTEVRSTSNPELQGNVITDGSEFPFIGADEVGAVNMAPVQFVGVQAPNFFTSSS